MSHIAIEERDSRKEKQALERPFPYYRGLREGGGESARLQVDQMECQVIEHEEEGTFRRRYRGKTHLGVDDVRGQGLCPRSLVFVPPDAFDSEEDLDDMESDAEDAIAEEMWGNNRVKDAIAREMGRPVVATMTLMEKNETEFMRPEPPRNVDETVTKSLASEQPLLKGDLDQPEMVAAMVKMPIDQRSLIEVHVGARPVAALLDTGAHLSVITRDFLRELPGYHCSKLCPTSVRIDSAAKTPMAVSHQYPLEIQLQGYKVAIDVYVVPDMVHPLVLGLDFCRKTQAKIDFSKATVTMETKPEARLEAGRYLPPYTACQATALVSEDTPDGTLCLLEGNHLLTEEGSVLVEPALVCVMNGQIPVGLSNEEPEGCTLAEDTLLTRVQILGGEDMIVPLPPGEEHEEEQGKTSPESVRTSPTSQNLNDQPENDVRKNPGPEIETPRNHLATMISGPHGATIDLRLSAINEEEAQELKELLNQYTDVFVGPDGRLGCTDLLQHTIRTDPEQPPISQRPYKVGYKARQIIEEQVNELLAQGLIKPSDSPWASPVVLVAKKDGTTRFCVDFRKLNQVTRMEQYPIPDIRQSLDVFGQAGAAYFSTLDLKSAFWQVKMDPESAPKTAFITVDGVYEFTVLPFGLCGAPITFSRLMAKAMRGLIWKNCLVYLDDVVVFSRTFSEHLVHLKEVLHRLRAANLKLSPTKCILARSQVHYLGHVVSGQGIAVDPKKIEAVKTFPEPTCVKEVRQFLGLAGYYRRYCKGFSRIAQPLHALTKKGIPYEWTQAAQKAFDDLKGLLISAPVLAYPDFDRPYRLYTDASGTAVGHVLSQTYPEGEKVIAYGGRALTSTEKRYGVTELEFLAVVHAIKTNDCYLRFSPGFTVVTDHSALKPMIEQKEPKGRISRWIMELAPYKPNIEYRPGKNHANADACSRRTYPEETARSEEPVEHLFAAAITRGGGKVPITPGDLQYERELQPGLRLSLWVGDVTKFRGCAVVNAANPLLRHEGGVARCISRMGGTTIQKGSHEHIKEHGPLRTTEVVALGAGNLNFTHVLHAVGPRYDANDGSVLGELYDTVLNVLNEAVRLNVITLVMPMISTGIFGFPPEVAVEIHKEAFDDFANDCDLGTLREIQVVDVKAPLLALLERKYRGQDLRRAQETPYTEGQDDPADGHNDFTTPGPDGKASVVAKTQATAREHPDNGNQGDQQDPEPEDDRKIPPDPTPMVPKGPAKSKKKRTWEDRPLGIPADAPIFRKLEGCDEQERLKYFQHAQQNDDECGAMLAYLQTGVLPLDAVEAAHLERTAPDYFVKDNILYHVNLPLGKRGQAALASVQLVLPQEFVHDLLHHYHDADVSAHRRYAAMYAQVRPKYFWRSMARDVHEYLQTCDKCARADRRAQQRNSALQPTEPAAVLLRIHLDIVGPLTKTKEGYKYILVMVDSCTRWAEFVPLQVQTAEAVVEAFYDQWICRYGVPKQVTTDRGKNFTAALTRAVNMRLGIKHVLTSAYHPQANGVCERRNKSMKEGIQRLIDNQSEMWAYYLPAVAHALNNAVNGSTGFSPYFLLFGREARRAADFLLPIYEDYPPDARAALEQVTHKISYHEKEARELDLAAREKYRRTHDEHVREEEFQVGDMVWCYTPDTARRYQTGRKLVSPYAGPFVITKRVSPVTVRLRRMSDDVEPDTNVHVNRLKRRHVRRTRPTEPPLQFQEGDLDDEGPLPPGAIPNDDWEVLHNALMPTTHYEFYEYEDPEASLEILEAIPELWTEM